MKLQQLLEHRVIRSFDRSVEARFDLVRGIRPIDRMFYAASEAANHSMLWHAINVVNLVRTRDPRNSALIAAALGVESALVNGPIKMLFRRGRPVLADDENRPHKLRKPKTSSFPSGHATSAFCAAALFTRLDPKRKVAYYATAIVVAFSRVHVKIHHPSDVVAGIGIGHLMGKVMRRAIR